MARVYRRLAADRAVDLGQQRGGNLDEVDTSTDDRGGKADEVTDHAAAKGDHRVGALDPGFQDEIAHCIRCCWLLVASPAGRTSSLWLMAAASRLAVSVAR
jgi:hypothetical protein